MMLIHTSSVIHFSFGGPGGGLRTPAHSWNIQLQIGHYLSSDGLPKASRPWRTPFWKLENRLRTLSGDREVICLKFSGAGAVPGTRFALGTRLGRPEVVRPPATGSFALAAAVFHPVSASERHSSSGRGSGAGALSLPNGVKPSSVSLTALIGPVSSAVTAGLTVRRRNQFDSMESKIGNGSLPFSGDGGTTVPWLLPVPYLLER
ncbi:hypothetical protein EV190_10653 [Actinorugispora endophytica]|uniref:Uncharacterized protein n=1 Tax=Actinorugispora endophytica TaxID=1605990 RepID=A0A4R6V1V5_9ACTN|nr:hypothetical protein EV190_10653 [Actinorugispora endophytica]